jgi:hypothetical protein
MSETTLGSYYFKHIAEEHQRKAKVLYPNRKVEVREVLQPHTQSKRPVFHVVLLGDENGQTAG